MLSPSSSPWLLIATAAAAGCAASAVRADEFSWQLSGVTSRVESGAFSRDSWAVDGTYYMNPIDDSAGPYALASFLDPTTRVSATASQSESFSQVADDPTAFTLNGAYVPPGKKWYFGANYAKADLDGVVQPVTRSDEKGYGILAGRYLGASTTLELGLNRSVHIVESSLCTAAAPCPPFVLPYSEETTTDAMSLDVFHVRRFRSLTYSLRGSVSQTRAHFDISSPLPSLVPAIEGSGPTLRVYSVAGELFPTKQLGIRLGYSRPDGESAEAESYGVGATWFFKPRLAVQLTLSRTTLDDLPILDGGLISFDGGTVQSSSISHFDSAGIRFIGRL